MEKAKCKLMFFLYLFGGGGAEKMILNVLNNIDNGKYDITLMLGIREHNEYLDLLTNKNVNIDYLDVPLGNDDLAIKVLADKINQYNPDILFTEARYTNWLAYHAKRVSKNKKVKLIFREASVRSFAENPKFKDKLRVFKHYNFGAKKIIAISEGVKQDLVKNYKINSKKITRIYNPLEIEKVKDLSDEKIDNKVFNKIKGRKIINVARLVDVKNQKMLIDAFDKLLTKLKDISLIILGKGALEEELKNYCKVNNIKNVYFLGFDVNPYKYVKNSDLFVLTSNIEGFGNALVEAMAIGIPVISTDCPYGPREILDNGKYGKLVTINDVDGLTSSMEMLLKNKEMAKTYVELAKERVKDFEVKKIVKEYESVIDRVYGNNKNEEVEKHINEINEYVSQPTVEYLINNGGKIGTGCKVHPSTIFGSEPYLIEIGNNVRIVDQVKFFTHDGGLWVLRKNNDQLKDAYKFGKIKIGDNCHIGFGASIMPGVTIGNNCIIGTGAIVTHDIPDNSVAIGVPAKVIETIDEYYKKNKEEILIIKPEDIKNKKEIIVNSLKKK